MSSIEAVGGSGHARGSLAAEQSSFSALSGTQKARSLQPATGGAAAGPVETRLAVMQPERAAKSNLRAAPAPATPAQSTLVKPMTAVLLHELRLQQELANVREEKEITRGKAG